MAGADAATIVEQVLRDPELQRALAAEPGTDTADRARECLREMVAVHDDRAESVFARMGGWFARAYGVDVDAAELAELAAEGRRTGLVLLPTHRSYLDPLVLGPVLRRAGLRDVHILGGVNLSFWPMGHLARRTGVVYIRRTFAGDAVYKACARAYFRYLVDRRAHLEWYIEGGRSRTGKLRPPRLGLLAYLADAVRDSDVDDVLLVPVSIVYDQLHEVALMAAEQRGGRKRPEGLAWMWRFGRAQGTRLGSAYVRLGTPLKLRAELDDGPHAVEKVAFEVCHRMNRATPITATALVTFALLGMKGRALTVADLRGVLDPLLDYVARRALPTAGAWDLDTDLGVIRTLDQLVATSVVVRYADDRAEGAARFEPVYAVNPARDLEAAFYRNSVVHFFLVRAIAEVVVAGVAERDSAPADGADVVPAAWADALALRDLLKYEFFFGRKAEYAEELRTELTLLDPDWEQRGGDPQRAAAGLRALRLHLAHRVLRSFLEAYRVVADRLAALPSEGAFDEDAFVAGCVPVARQYHLQHRIHSSESISEELFRTALRLADNRGLLATDGAGLDRRRAAFATEIRAALGRIERISRLATTGDS